MIEPAFANTLATRFGTPLYVYDLDEVDARHAELSSVLPEGARLYYSLKANPLPAIARALRERGCEAEISSPGELGAALAAGFDPAAMLYTGPGKSTDELAAALSAGVGCFSAESWVDATRISAAARAKGVRPDLLFRVNPGPQAVAGLSMAGPDSPFGFEESALDETQLAAVGESVRARGIHVYAATQLAGPAELLAAFETALAAAGRATRALGVEASVIDLGGGFPWPYATAGKGPDLAPLRASLAALGGPAEGSPSPALWFESGRRLVASSGTLLTRVLDDKRGGSERRHVVVDAGIHVLGGLSGLGRLFRPKLTATLVDPSEARGDAAAADLVGPLCSPLDVLGQGVSLPPLPEGALLAIPNVGAYGLTASLVGFLSRPPPVEVLCRGDAVKAVYQLRTGHQEIG